MLTGRTRTWKDEDVEYNGAGRAGVRSERTEKSPVGRITREIQEWRNFKISFKIKAY